MLRRFGSVGQNWETLEWPGVKGETETWVDMQMGDAGSQRRDTKEMERETQVKGDAELA